VAGADCRLVLLPCPAPTAPRSCPEHDANAARSHSQTISLSQGPALRSQGWKLQQGTDRGLHLLATSSPGAVPAVPALPARDGHGRSHGLLSSFGHREGSHGQVVFHCSRFDVFITWKQSGGILHAALSRDASAAGKSSSSSWGQAHGAHQTHREDRSALTISRSRPAVASPLSIPQPGRWPPSAQGAGSVPLPALGHGCCRRRGFLQKARSSLETLKSTPSSNSDKFPAACRCCVF